MRKIYEKLTSPDTFLSSLSGLFLVLSFPKIEFSGLAFIAILPLLFTLNRSGRKLPALACGVITGFVFSVGGLYWLTITMENYGGIPRVGSLIILLIFSFYLSLYVGLFAWGTVRMGKAGIPLMVSAPLLWVALEYARGHLLTGFPWNLLGYTQYNNLLMIQISDITAVYGVSFLLVLINAALTQMLLTLKNLRPFRELLAPILTILISIGLTVSYGAYRINEIRTAQPERSIRVGVVQGNIEQDQKWDPRFRDNILAVYTRLSQRAAEEQPDLILWPEASVPFYFMADREYQSKLLALIDDFGIDLLFGSPDTMLKNGEQLFFNSVFLVSPGAELRGRYDKIHLVPFGEYVPLRKALFFVRPIIDQIGDMTPGREVSLMQTTKGTCGTPICYEVILPDLVRRFVLAGADFIATLTNDDWFGRSSAPYQHFSMAVFRAVENRVPLVRSANSGISGVVAPDGRILKETGIFVESVFTERLPLLERSKTFYTRFGDLFAFLCIAGSIFCFVFVWILRIRSRGSRG
jgi:apolipoprotein N-acyltransferase